MIGLTTKKNERPEKSGEIRESRHNVLPLLSTRNTAGMTSEGRFVEFVLECDPRIAASYVTRGFSARTTP